MRKLLILFILISSGAHAQLLSGDLVAEGRKLLTETDFTTEGELDGWAIYELAVDRTGKVTSAQIKESNINKTIPKIQLRNHLMAFKFEAGTHYPKFHHVRVKITMIESENAPRPKEAEINLD